MEIDILFQVITQETTVEQISTEDMIILDIKETAKILVDTK